ncbi:cupin domain-containing protein [Dechloromonas sp. HYN0024]|uniref:cupin domain-containing protein n=1 Tax=Dechloromonas sp. HYN0024 TaxID=2231055 RepID=UPI000E43E941|nr:cupin domain-containing protein [Dechloromonas sp. HYN0024]AXS79890.1 cupin domain-containing protein [Dechloromonas sp. HYN0024]
MTLKTVRNETIPYITKDGSEIRELLHPAQHAVRHQSLAEAVIPPGTKTLLHRHGVTEEIYHVTRGAGRMTLAAETFVIAPGDSIPIPPGSAHCVENTGAEALHILCCCAPAYSHEDTELL